MCVYRSVILIVLPGRWFMSAACMCGKLLILDIWWLLYFDTHFELLMVNICLQKQAVVQHLYLGRNAPMLTDMRVVRQSTDDDHLVFFTFSGNFGSIIFMCSSQLHF